MSEKPVLVLQTRRLGDAILTIPLWRDLTSIFAGHPVFIVLNPAIHRQLAPLYKNIPFIAANKLPCFAGESLEAVINLDGHEASSVFTAKARASLKLGKMSHDRSLTVQGFWQLYRENLTQNNYHNIFHWADLFRMDLRLPPPCVLEPPHEPAENRIVGLFVGASDALKRPDAQFWALLSQKLANNGLAAILLGGPAEKALGAQIMSLGGMAKNLCGKTSLAELRQIMPSLDLFITPDTGPMHLACQTRTPILNLSLGNVNAHETGPYAINQLVLRAAISCSGCWQCQQPQPFCKNSFNPEVVGDLILSLCRRQPSPRLPGLELLTTGRDKFGFYQLSSPAPSTRDWLDQFWKQTFLHFSGCASFSNNNSSFHDFYAKSNHPDEGLADSIRQVAHLMEKSLQRLSLRLVRSHKTGKALPDDFWQTTPRHSRLFAGYIHMFLQNGNYSGESFTTAINRIEEAIEFARL